MIMRVRYLVQHQGVCYTDCVVMVCNGLYTLNDIKIKLRDDIRETQAFRGYLSEIKIIEILSADSHFTDNTFSVPGDAIPLKNERDVERLYIKNERDVEKLYIMKGICL